MAAINRYRIVGARYKQQTRMYTDKMFEFGSDNKPQNGIITGKNTFGKGVFLQILFQPLIPLTTWNRGKNTVNHFFYGKNSNFQPYTFYSCIEFILPDDQFLLVGIALTSKLNDNKECEPVYTLFVRQYGFSLVDDFTIGTLKLYDEEKEMPIPYSEFEKFLKDNKKEFLTYTENTKAKFYRLLEEDYGIIKKDWEQLIDINQYEGGVSNYFDDKNSTTNHGLFSNMIIPAIETRLSEEGEEESLITLFKSSAAIARNLPELKKNVSSYQEIKNHNSEIYSKLFELIDEKDKHTEHLEKGRSILTAFSNHVTMLEKERNQHETEHGKLMTYKKTLEWKIQNLQYLEKYNQHSKLLQDLKNGEAELEQRRAQEETLKGETEHAELLLQLRIWQERDQKMEGARQQIEILEQSKEFQDTMGEQQRVKDGILLEWKSVAAAIEDILTASNSYVKHIKTKQKAFTEEIEDFNRQLLDYKVERGTLKESTSKFEAGLEEGKQFYGEAFYYEMENMLEQKEKKLKESIANHDKLVTEQELKQQDKSNVLPQKGAIEQEIKALNRDQVKLKQQLKDQQEKEVALANKVWSVLRVNSADIPNFRTWIPEQKSLLENKKDDWELRLNRLNLQWYELAFEVKQKDEPFLIPSEEVYKVKSLLTERGIAVSYGDEYIKQQEPGKRVELNQRHPLLKYGLIIPAHHKSYMAEIQKINKEYFHTPIPIFWVGELEKMNEMPFILLDKKATDLSIHDEELIQYKEELSTKGLQIKAEIDSTSRYIKEIHSVVAALESFDVRVIAKELVEQVSQLGSSIKIKENEEKAIQEEMESIDDVLREISGKMKSVSATVSSLGEEVKRLEQWIVTKNKYGEDTSRLTVVNHEIGVRDRKIKAREKESEEVGESFDLWMESYRDWKYKKDELVKEVRTAISQALNPVEQPVDTMTTEQPVLQLTKTSLTKWLYQWDALQQEINQRNSKLIVLKNDLKHYRELAEREEAKLRKLNSQWKQYDIPSESILMLESKFETKQKELQSNGNQISALSTKIDIYSTQAKSSEQELSRLKTQIHNNFYNDLGKTVEIWGVTDFEKMSSEAEKELKGIKKDITDTNEIINDLTHKLDQYERYTQNMKATLNALNIVDGSIPSSYIQESILKNPEKTWGDWIKVYKKIEEVVNEKRRILQNVHRKKKEVFEKSEWVLEIKDMALKVYNDMDFDELEEIKASVEGLDLLATSQIAATEDERNEAEEAKREWVEHACKYALQIIENLRKMIKAMKITNRNNIPFPLVKLKKENTLPKEAEQIRGNIEDLYDKAISELFIDYVDVEPIPKKVLKNKIGTRNIIFAALNYHYPTLLLYRLHEENSFLYEPPKAEFYTEWETINEASKTDPTGSGGQIFSARTLILMMLISFKRTNEDKSNWKPLITDNPFSVAVSEHIVDPILAIAEELKFQWIVVTPPELVMNVQLLQKFDVYYQLSAKNSKHGRDTVESEVQYGYRNYKKSNRVMKPD